MIISSDSWDGQVRKLHSHGCLICNKEFFAPLKAKAKYCSKECLRLRPRKEVKLTCAFCKIEFYRKPSNVIKSKRGVFFCSRICKDAGQTISNGFEEIWPSHYGSSKEYKNKISLEKCIGCGESRKFLLLIHHIDGDREHNKKENLECVCFNCHAIRHLHLEEGEWRYWTKVLTPRADISKITLGA